MIITTIKIHGRSGKRKEIVQTINGLSEQMIKNGECLRADLCLDLDVKDTFYFMVEWQTRKDLEKYKSSKSLAVLLADSVEIINAVRLE
jgi:quinol monooxygenase YgiN